MSFENAKNLLETWDELIARHERERRELFQSLSDSGYTQSQAAQIIGRKLTFVNTYAKRYGVDWKVKKQGQRNDI